MAKKRYKLSSKVILYPGMGAWHFLVVDKPETARIQKEFASFKKGWGSLPVNVTLGKTKWKTSIFPDTKSGVYLLPLKAAVRRAEGAAGGDRVTFSIQILVGE